MLTIVLVSAMLSASVGTLTSPLRVRIIPVDRPAPEAIIVGRTVCGGITWLLNQKKQLVAIGIEQRRISVQAIAGFRSEEDPWGLACLSDGSLWTLASARTLAGIRSHAVTDRTSLPLPRFALFATGDHLLYAEMPVVVGKPVLATGRASPPFAQRPWVGLLGRTAPSSVGQLTKNLIGCGIGVGEQIPCWFADENLISIGDGTAQTVRRAPISNSPGVDPTLPIRDVALAGPDRVWVLARAARGIAGTQPGGRLIATDRLGTASQGVDLRPAARLILAATETTCWLLTIDGMLMEVSVQ